MARLVVINNENSIMMCVARIYLTGGRDHKLSGAGEMCLRFNKYSEGGL